jgi:predicted TIM-barrel fold metal-dependent hydrolase
MVVDCHCHAGPGDGLTGPWDTRARLDKFLRWSQEAGIQHTVLFAAFHSDYLAANRTVARIVKQDPNRFTGFAFVHPERDRGRVRAMIREAVEEHGFRGIKVHRHDARITREICEVARAYRLPVLYDVMGEVSVCELLATEYPEVAFIIPHLGSFADDWQAQLAFLGPLSRHPNIFTDSSGVRRFDLLLQAVQLGGPAKLLFGSDGPWLHPGVELAKVKALKLPPEAESLVLGGNCLRLLRGGWKASAAATPLNPAATAGELDFRVSGRSAGPPSLYGGAPAARGSLTSAPGPFRDPWAARESQGF